ncbi:MAG: thiamine pyrophosphate-binding protein [Pseudomonadota bacterium]
MSNSLCTGAELLVDGLVTNGADLVFGVPGESYLAVLDALYDRRDALRFITCRQEGGAANMADAYAKLTGRPGICMVTRGPGATNASIGIHTAFQDSSPVILFIGQVGRDMMEREAFQEVDYRRMFGPMAKWVAQIDSADRVPEFVSRAFHTATSGRPGPVVLALPEDMLRDRAPAQTLRPHQPSQASPSDASIAELRARLSKAERPLALLGGGTWTPEAVDDIAAFVHSNSLPVACSFRAMDCFDNRDPHYIGQVGLGLNSALADRLRQADLLLAIGPRLGEITTAGYSHLSVPAPDQSLVHIHPGAEELNRVYQADLAIVSGMPQAAAALRRMVPVDGSAWAAWRSAARADQQAFFEPTDVPGQVNLGTVVRHVSDTVPDDAVITTGAGNYAAFVGRFYQYRRYRTLLGPTSGAMGYGVPSAVAAKIAKPERTVVSFNGDGCFLMNGQELATAVQYDAPVAFIVANNATYGTIRMHQERDYPDRVLGTDLRNPDFAALAAAYGAWSTRVDKTEDFPAAFDAALAAGRPALIELTIDPEAISPSVTLSAIRGAGTAS